MRENKFNAKDYRYCAFGLSAVAFISFILACVIKTGLAVFFGIVAGVTLIGGCICLYLAHRLVAAHTNPFLFDRRRNLTLSPKDLTFAFVEDNLTHFLSGFTENTLDLWNGIPKNLEMALQAEPAYRTPVAFKMLYDLSGLSETEILALFEATEKKTLAAVCRAVKAGGDKEMADILFEMKCDSVRLQARIVPFFVKNRRCFEGRLFRYVKEHIDEYDKK